MKLIHVYTASVLLGLAGAALLIAAYRPVVLAGEDARLIGMMSAFILILLSALFGTIWRVRVSQKVNNSGLENCQETESSKSKDVQSS